MGMNFYAHIKAKYKPFDYNDPVSSMYEELEDDPKVEELTNGYVWNHTYYKDIDSLNKDYYHVLHIGKSSVGWHFALCIYPLIGINSLDDWKKSGLLMTVKFTQSVMKRFQKKRSCHTL